MKKLKKNRKNISKKKPTTKPKNKKTIAKNTPEKGNIVKTIKEITGFSNKEEPLTERQLKTLGDIHKPIILLTKKLSKIDNDVREIKSKISNEYLEEKIAYATKSQEEKYNTLNENYNKKAAGYKEQSANLMELNAKIEKLQLKVEGKATDIKLITENYKLLKDDNEKLKREKGDLSTYSTDRNDKIKKIKEYLPGFTQMVDMNTLSEKKFNILLEICFQIENNIKIDTISKNPDLMTDGVFNDNFSLTILTTISRLMCEFGIEKGFEEIRSDLNLLFPPYELLKPIEKGQSVNIEFHHISEDDEHSEIVKYYTLTILNKELGNQIVKKAIIETV